MHARPRRRWKRVDRYGVVDTSARRRAPGHRPGPPRRRRRRAALGPGCGTDPGHRARRGRRRRQPGRRRHQRPSMVRRVQAHAGVEPDLDDRAPGHDDRCGSDPAERLRLRFGGRLLRRPWRRGARRAVLGGRRLPRRPLPAVGGSGGGRSFGRHPRRRDPHRHRADAQGRSAAQAAAPVQARARGTLRQRQAMAELDLTRRRGRRDRPSAGQPRRRCVQPDRTEPGDQRRVRQDPRRGVAPAGGAADPARRTEAAARRRAGRRCSTRASAPCPPPCRSTATSSASRSSPALRALLSSP